LPPDCMRLIAARKNVPSLPQAHAGIQNRTGTDRLLDAAAMPNCANPARFRERSLVGSGSYSVTPHRQIGALKWLLYLNVTRATMFGKCRGLCGKYEII
jgi:hypothetical protein